MLMEDVLLQSLIKDGNMIWYVFMRDDTFLLCIYSKSRNNWYVNIFTSTQSVLEALVSLMMSLKMKEQKQNILDKREENKNKCLSMQSISHKFLNEIK